MSSDNTKIILDPSHPDVAEFIRAYAGYNDPHLNGPLYRLANLMAEQVRPKEPGDMGAIVSANGHRYIRIDYAYVGRWVRCGSDNSDREVLFWSDFTNKGKVRVIHEGHPG